MSVGQTSRYQIPFPYGDDPLVNGDDVIQQLAERIDQIGQERYEDTRTMYHSLIRYPLQAISLDTTTRPAGPYEVVHYDGAEYGSIAVPFPMIDITNGIITIPETGFYEIHATHAFDPLTGVTTRGMWRGGWTDNTERIWWVQQFGFLDSELSSTDITYLNFTMTLPFAAGQTVWPVAASLHADVNISGLIHLVGPLSRQARL